MSRNPLPVRSPLEILQLEFPHHDITMQTINDKLFYLAEAKEPGVQPSFAQAATAARLGEKLRAPVKEFTTTEPSIARVWDFLLGGKDNFAVDQQQAERLLTVFPRAAELARESRQFQARAVTYVAGQGVGQFIDAGCGLPTKPNTHETAREIQPEAAVVYADNDELVLSHARSILARTQGVLPIAGDIGYPDEILYDWRARRLLDFHQPVCVVLAMTLHFYDAENARRIAAQFIHGIPDGSYVIVSAGQLEGEAGDRLTREYQPGRLHHHSAEDVASFLRALDLVDPGVTEAGKWRAPAFTAGGSRRGHIWAAVGQKAIA